jgi:hypothetical protein
MRNIMGFLPEKFKFQLILMCCILSLQSIPFSYALEPTKVAESLTEGMTVSVGLEFDSGDYGTTDTTDTWRIPVGLYYTKGAFFAGAEVPYIDAESTGNIIVRHTRMGTITSGSSSSASGLGDVNLYAGYRIPSKDSADTSYSVSAHVKLATADENEGLGTGEQDYAIEGGMVKKLATYSLFASIGYQFTGDSPTVDYDDVVYLNGGIAMPQKNGNQIGAMVDYSQATTSGFDDALELTGFINMPLENKRSIYMYLLLGLSDGSPDHGIGASYRFPL